MECHHHRHPSSLSTVNPGTGTILTSHEFKFMSHIYRHDLQSTEDIKKILFADEEGNFTVITFHCGDSVTSADSSFFSAELLPPNGVLSFLFGHKQALFTSGSTLGVIPDVLLDEHTGDAKVTPGRVVKRCFPVLQDHSFVNFDEGTGILLAYSLRGRSIYIIDMVA